VKGKNKVIDDSSSTPSCNLQTKNRVVLNEVQNDVVTALASTQSNSDNDVLAQHNDPSFKNFINGLASSNSDKSFHLKRQFGHILPPIEENVAENDGLPDEQVDYGSGTESVESSQASDMPFINPGQGFLALAAPSLRHEHTVVVIPVDGSQPEVECTQEELASQVDNPPEDEGNQQGDMHVDAATRRSSRVTGQGSTSTRIDDKAKAAAEKKDLSGTSLNTSNSFHVLDDDDINARALEMDVSHDSFPPEK
jgi:hypothetical protein